MNTRSISTASSPIHRSSPFSITCLPPDILTQILRESYIEPEYEWRYEGFKHYVELSRVHRRFTRPCQALAWEYLSFFSGYEIDLCLASPLCGKLPVHRIKINWLMTSAISEMAIHPSDVVTLLKKCNGFENLELLGTTGSTTIPKQFLLGPHLRELRTLTIPIQFVGNSSEKFDFSLKSLSLYNGGILPKWNQSVFQELIQQTCQNLEHLDLWKMNTFQVLPALESVCRRVNSLALPHARSRLSLYLRSDFLDIIETSTRLHTLKFTQDNEDKSLKIDSVELNRIPKSVRYLEIEGPNPVRIDHLAKFLQNETRGRVIEQIMFGNSRNKWGKSLRIELEQICQRTSVRLVFVTDQNWPM